MPISRFHKNRKPYNWLFYDIGDKFLSQFSDYYRGDLYDLGCGDMPYRNWFLNHVDHYIGVDWSDSLHTHNADILADLNMPLPIKSEVADTVISLSVMEHLQNPQNFLVEAHRILKPSGTMILQVPFMWWVHEAPFDFFRFTRHGLVYLFEQAGFQSIEIYPQTGFWVMFTLKFNYQTTRLIGGSRPMRAALSLLFHGIWAINQRIAPWLDLHWPCEEETAGYFVIARKK